MQQVIVDGYNVIYADPDLRREMTAEPERARRALLDRIRSYLADKQLRVTVVFDGAGGLSGSEAVVPGRLQAVFTAAGESADALIVRTLERAGSARGFIVVSSDVADIGRAARALGARVLPSEAFLARIAGRGGERGTAQGAREKPDPDEADVAFWLERFEERADPKGD
jgi:predicted RNA-binding protein with PIN domain